MLQAKCYGFSTFISDIVLSSFSIDHLIIKCQLTLCADSNSLFAFHFVFH